MYIIIIFCWREDYNYLFPLELDFRKKLNIYEYNKYSKFRIVMLSRLIPMYKKKNKTL